MIIKPLDGLTRYHVEPESKKEKDDYLVDLELHGGNGFCSCPHFQYKIAPALARGTGPGDETRCKHIKEVRTHLAESLLNIFLKQKMQTSKKEVQ